MLSWANSRQDSIVVAKDTASVLHDRALLKELDQKYSGEDFNYDIKTGESQNLLERFFRWLGRWMDDTFGIRVPPAVFNVMKWLIYVLMSGLIIYLIIKLLVKERFEAIFTKQAKSIVDIELAEKHIATVNFDQLLADALKNKDYRLAVRYLFLKLLKRLSQKDIIAWHFEKTNQDYQKEIKEPRLQSKFKELTYLYDYVWYGEQSLDATTFEKANKRFEKMNQLLP